MHQILSSQASGSRSHPQASEKSQARLMYKSTQAGKGTRGDHEGAFVLEVAGLSEGSPERVQPGCGGTKDKV